MLTNVKVFVKGSWEGIKEMTMELDQETIEKFKDESENLYAICVYEKGEPTYMFTVRKMWENWDEVRKIMNDQSLSQEDRIAMLKKQAE